jgi:MFS family permease
VHKHVTFVVLFQRVVMYRFTAGLTIKRVPRHFGVSAALARPGNVFLNRTSSASAAAGLGGSEEDDEPPKTDIWREMLPRWLFKEHIVAKDNFNRWLVPPAAIGTHLSIGSVYAWSMFNDPLTREFGVVASAAQDWTLQSVVPVFSTSIVCLGMSAAIAGKWLEDVGPRLVGGIAACCWGGGFMLGSLGISMHSLPLLYLGYGVLGGCGLGLGYVSPVSTLIRWFPDRRGMATGMAIMGFGGGAMIAAPVKKALISSYFVAPEYLGPASKVDVQTNVETGARIAEDTSGNIVDVVVASASDVAKLGVEGLQEGVYVVGTGCSGTAETFMTLGSVYFCTMIAASLMYRVPKEGWLPEGFVPPSAAAEGSDGKEQVKGNPMVTTENVDINESLKTRQFYLLWTNLFCNVAAGIGVLGVAKTMMSDIFETAMPTVVDGTFAATYVSMISVANMSGRFFWASASDYIGRKNTYFTFFGLGIPLYLSIPYTAQLAGVSDGVTPLVMFYGASMCIFTMYGGGFATIPAYLADIFGTKHVGGIHGRLLTSWSMAGLVGPMGLTTLRKHSTDQAIVELTDIVDDSSFSATFGAGKEKLEALMDANTVTISKLMEIAPVGTVDPTAGIYTTTMYACSGLLGLALLSNAAIGPVDPKHHMEKDKKGM